MTETVNITNQINDAFNALAEARKSAIETEAALRKVINNQSELIGQMREAFERINGAAWRIKLAQGNSACSCESLNAADIIAWSSEHSKADLSAAERGLK